MDAWVVVFLDISRAHLHSAIRREVFVMAPKEAGLPEGWCWRLNKAMYGLRDASSCFDFQTQGIMKELGFEVGEFSPCLYRDARSGFAASCRSVPATVRQASDHEGAREVALDSERQRVFKSAAMRLSYLAQDRLEIQFAAKEVARQMANPCVSGWESLKRVV
eukprot:6477774-Amphidinium_carterae.1